MTSEEIFDVLRPIIMSVTGVPECILEYTGLQSPAPSPQGVYAAVRPQQSITQRGQANINRKAGVLAQTQEVDVRAQILCKAWVNFYRGDAPALASRLHQCNKRPDVSAALYRAKLGWMGTDAVNNLTELQSENMESRAMIAINLSYETSDPVVINSIESVAIEVQYEDGTTIVTDDVVSGT